MMSDVEFAHDSVEMGFKFLEGHMVMQPQLRSCSAKYRPWINLGTMKVQCTAQACAASATCLALRMMRLCNLLLSG